MSEAGAEAGLPKCKQFEGRTLRAVFEPLQVATRTRKQKKCRPVEWQEPGTVTADPNAPQPVIDVVSFGVDQCLEKRVSAEWVQHNRHLNPVLWVNVDGLGDAKVIQELGRIFQLHQLSLEDVANSRNRPKVEVYDGFLFVVVRMFHLLPDHQMEIEQLSLFLGADYVITFQEGIPGDCFEPVRARLRKDGSRLRSGGADFLAYHLIDAVIDGYFPLLERLGERLEDLENVVIDQPSRAVVAQIHDIKRELLLIRRAVWPLREAINSLVREELPMITPETRIFLRDCYDHCVQIIDLVESYRELGSGLMDVYLSNVSNRMNEVMKVLTIITTIFVPLTFVAGVYGMNFNPEKSPFNMPELNAYWGYPMAMAAMAVIALLELYYFWKKGWLWSGHV